MWQPFSFLRWWFCFAVCCLHLSFVSEEAEDIALWAEWESVQLCLLSFLIYYPFPEKLMYCRNDGAISWYQPHRCPRGPLVFEGGCPIKWYYLQGFDSGGFSLEAWFCRTNKHKFEHLPPRRRVFGSPLQASHLALHSGQRKGKCSFQDTVLCSWWKCQAVSSRNVLCSFPALSRKAFWYSVGFALCPQVVRGAPLAVVRMKCEKRLRTVNAIRDCEARPKTKFALRFRSPRSAQLGKRTSFPVTKAVGGISRSQTLPCVRGPLPVTGWSWDFLLRSATRWLLFWMVKESAAHWLPPRVQIPAPPPAWCEILSKSPHHLSSVSSW